MITATLLKNLFPDCRDPQSWAPILTAACKAFGIAEPAHVAAFLAQIGHESGQLNRLSENLNYSARGLVAMWPRRFPTLDFAQTYARQPEKIANYVYANRLGNGPVESGDGWKYRGRGLIQVTGRDNYATLSASLGGNLLMSPQRLLDPVWAARSAAWFWHANNLNACCDDIALVTRKVTGGNKGLVEREVYWKNAKELLNVRDHA